MISRNLFSGASVNKDHRFDKIRANKKVKLSKGITESLVIDKINYDSFHPWVHDQLASITDDEFVEDIIMGFLQADTVNSQDLAEQLQSLIGDKAIEFIEKLWPLLEDAQNSETGIPSVFIEEAKKKIAERLKSNQNISNKLDESESSSSYTSSSSYNSSSSSSDSESTDISHDQMHNNKDLKISSNQPIVTQNTPIKPKILPSKPLKPPVIPRRDVKKQELKPILIENTNYPYNEKNSSKRKRHHSNHHKSQHHSHSHRRHDSSTSSSDYSTD